MKETREFDWKRESLPQGLKPLFLEHDVARLKPGPYRNLPIGAFPINSTKMPLRNLSSERRFSGTCQLVETIEVVQRAVALADGVGSFHCRTDIFFGGGDGFNGRGSEDKLAEQS